MRDSTIIYRSFFEAIKELPKDAQADCWNAIMEYSLNFNEIDLTGISKTIFILIKPQLDANLKRFENGNKPKKSKSEANGKQDVSKSEANNNNNVNNNNNHNENDNCFEQINLGNGFFLNSLPKDLALNEIDISKTITYIKLKTKIDVQEKFVVDFWEAFKIENFDKKEWKNNLDEVITHFRNSLKIQIEKNGNANRQNFNSGNDGASSKSERKLEALRKLV